MTNEKTTKDVNVGDGMMGGYNVVGTSYSIKDPTLAAKATDIKKMVFSEGIEAIPDEFGAEGGNIYPNLEEVVYPSTRKQQAEFSGDISGLANGYWAFEGDTLHLYGNGEWTSNYNWGPQPWSALDYTAIKKVVFHEGITTIPINFAGPTSVTADKTWKMNNIEEITLPSTLKFINDEAFIGVAVNKINGGFPEGLERIERQAFQNHKLDATVGKALIFPASLKSIGENAFHTGSRYITAPAGFSVVAFEEGSQLEKIGPRAFPHEIELKTVVIPAGVTELGSRAFESDVDNGIVVYFEGKPTTIGATVFGTRKNVTLFSLADGLTNVDGIKVTRAYRADKPIKAPNQTSAHILLTRPYDGVNGLLNVGEKLNVKAIKTSAQNKLPGNFGDGIELPKITAQVVTENVVKIEGIPVLQAGEKITLTLNGVKDTLGNAIENNTIMFYSDSADNGLVSAKFYDVNGDEIIVTDTTIAAGTRKMVFTSADYT